MALDEAQPDSNPEGSVALLPEPFVVNAQAVELAAAAARAALRRTSAALSRAARPPAPPQLGQLFDPPLDPFLAAALPIKPP
jgi:hypothetical protein